MSQTNAATRSSAETRVANRGAALIVDDGPTDRIEAILHWRQIEPPAPALSSREKQTLSLVVRGYMNREIAARLFLAESTVKSHLSSAFSKLGVRSRHEAVSLILDPNRSSWPGVLSLSEQPKTSTPAMPQ